MLRSIAISLAISAGAATNVIGQELSAARRQALQESLDAGDLYAAPRLVQEQCAQKLASSQDKELKVSERAERAREALACAKLMGAAGIAAVQPERATQVQGLVDASLITYERNHAVAESENEFLGLRWGVGVGVTRLKDPSVTDAAIVNGIVRQTSVTQDQPRALFEYHKMFWCNDKGTVGTRGCGPFVAVAATDKKVLSGVALGLVYGWKTSATETEGFSIGIGAVLDSSVRDLGKGFVADEPPPVGETAVRFTTRARWSGLIFVTRVF